MKKNLIKLASLLLGSVLLGATAASVIDYGVGVMATAGSDTVKYSNFTPESTENTGYRSHTYKSTTTNAEYTGVLNYTGTQSTIQIRSNDKESGLISSESAGYIESITVNWNSDTLNDRKLNIYGSNTKYASPADLYASSLATVSTLTYATGTVSDTYTFTQDYNYFGIRSNYGAIMFDSIVFTWKSGDVDTLTGVSYTGTPIEQTIGFAFDPTGLEFFAEYTTQGKVAIETNAVTFSPARIAADTTKVTATYEGFSCEITGFDVAEYVAISPVTIDLTKDNTSSMSDELVEWKYDHVSVSVTKGGSIAPNSYMPGGTTDASQTRAYNGNPIVFSVGEGFVIDSVVFNGVSSDSGLSTTTSFTVENCTFEGATRVATFTSVGIVNSITVTPGETIKLVSFVISFSAFGSNEFATYANGLLDADCTALSVSETTWGSITAAYGNLSAAEKAVLVAATASDTGSEVEQFASRYDYIVAKYSYTDFIGRNVQSSSLNSFVDSSNLLLPAVLIITALTAVSVIAIVLVIKRRKTN